MATLFAGPEAVKEAHGNSLAGLTMPAAEIPRNETGGDQGMVEPVSVSERLLAMRQLSGANSKFKTDFLESRYSQLNGVIDKLPSALRPPVA
jgi:hypothetical protein